MNRIQHIFKERSKKVIPFITAGYPNKSDSLGMVLAAESAGASMIEIGMPFSDPLADGPIIQKSSQIALNNGVTLPWILKLVSEIRKQSDIPLALMGYVNPIMKFGLEDFLIESSSMGIDGLIVPDLPPEEGDDYIVMAKEKNISPILLVAPNTPPNRINEISILARDLLYCVAILGVGGIVGAILTGVFSAASLGGSGINTETIGSQGLYIHPNIWHEGVFPIQEKCSFQGRQGKVHARVSIDLQKEFKKYIFFKTSMN